MVAPKITVARKSNQKAFYKAVVKMQKMAAYVGVPAEKSSRQTALLEIVGRTIGNSPTAKKKRARAVREAQSGITNAEALFLLTKGSPLRGQPPRPVLEPAIAADGNRQAIAHELAEAGKATLAGDSVKASQRLKRAALAGQNAARGWFGDQRNGWPRNAPSTIAHKGSDRPGIDLGLLRNAIVGITREE